MRRLVVNADDLGLSPGVNEGIAEAHEHGIVTSASLMVERPAAAQAVALAREHSRLSLGLHFEEPRDIDLDDPPTALAELDRQLAVFERLAGRAPTHIDSHHHVHRSRDRLATFALRAAELGVPLRGDGRVRYIGGFFGQWEAGVTELERVSPAFLRSLLDTEVGEGWSELCCHPARLTGDFSSSYYEEREHELRTLTQPGLADELAAEGIELVSFAAWA